MKKKLGMNMALCILALSLTAPILRAETTVATKTYNATASVAVVNTLTASLLNVSNNLAATAIAFGSVSNGGAAWNKLTPQYVSISVSDNALSWRLRAYTDNYTFQPSAALWGYSYGGLKLAGATASTTTPAKIPMAWQCSTFTVAALPTGDPSAAGSAWTFIKDAKDVDDPGTTGVGQNESFASSDAAGYTNIAFGSAGYTAVVKPTALPNKNITLPTTNAAFYWYSEADFGSAPAASYDGVIKLELLNQ